jgi:2-keto-4-pentenoate hydratase/2-oxohepta-3-ene-1,7-dioic acid hydratase in catechol pathway
MQDDRTANLVLDVSELVSYMTKFMALEPGDLVLTGTPAGVAFARDPKVFLRPSDEYEMRIEGIGSLLSRFVAERVA